MAAAAVVHDNVAAAPPEIVHSDLGAATTTLTTNTDTECNTQSNPEPIVNGHSTDVGSISITWEEIYQFYTRSNEHHTNIMRGGDSTLSAHLLKPGPKGPIWGEEYEATTALPHPSSEMGSTPANSDMVPHAHIMRAGVPSPSAHLLKSDLSTEHLPYYMPMHQGTEGPEVTQYPGHEGHIGYDQLDQEAAFCAFIDNNYSSFKESAAHPSHMRTSQ